MKKNSSIVKNKQIAPKKTAVVEVASREPILTFTQRYQAFFESTTDAVAIFSLEGEILDANPQLLKIIDFIGNKCRVGITAEFK